MQRKWRLRIIRREFCCRVGFISVINDYLRKKKMREVDIEAIAAVPYLALNEVG
jgi:hypothetical protein